MPVSYQYSDHEGNSVKLSRIDDEICADLGVTPHPVNYCTEYQIIMYLGFAILASQGGTRVTPSKLDAWWRACEAAGDDRELYMYTLLRKYAAGGKYTYEAWR